MTDTIHIVLSSDDNYAQHLGVVALSLLANTPQPQHLFFHVLDAGISVQNREKIASLIRRHGANHHFYCPDMDRYSNIPHKRYGVAALFRLSLADILPRDITRVIYLDCDVLVFDDIKKLWETELNENIVGAVTNLGDPPFHMPEMADGDYFNSGVLLIDLQKWRNNQIGETTLAYMNENADQLIYPDQDGMNHTLQNKWQRLHLRWNLQPASYSMYRKGRTQVGISTEMLHEAIQAPGLVHYLGNNKPWVYTTYHPLKENYWYYLRKSPWTGAAMDGYTLARAITRALTLDKLLKRWIRRFTIPSAVRNKGR